VFLIEALMFGAAAALALRIAGVAPKVPPVETGAPGELAGLSIGGTR
jgi:hypothetical protein